MRNKINKKEDMLKLIKQGFSLNQISKKLALPKTTVYYHFRKIKGKTIKKAKITNNQEQIGELIGAFAGDGTFHKDKGGTYRITFSTYYKEEKYAARLKKILKDAYNCSVFEYKYKPVIMTRIQQKLVIEHFLQFLKWTSHKKSKTVSLKLSIPQYSKAFLKGFIRGLIDTDGTVDTYGRICCTTISKELMRNLFKAYCQFGFNPKRWIRTKNVKNFKYSVVISRREANKYLKIIQFGNKYKEEKLKQLMPL